VWTPGTSRRSRLTLNTRSPRTGEEAARATDEPLPSPRSVEDPARSLPSYSAGSRDADRTAHSGRPLKPRLAPLWSRQLLPRAQPQIQEPAGRSARLLEAEAGAEPSPVGAKRPNVAMGAHRPPDLRRLDADSVAGNKGRGSLRAARALSRLTRCDEILRCDQIAGGQILTSWSGQRLDPRTRWTGRRRARRSTSASQVSVAPCRIT
jgi:hypothetical protein